MTLSPLRDAPSFRFALCLLTAAVMAACGGSGGTGDEPGAASNAPETSETAVAAANATTIEVDGVIETTTDLAAAGNATAVAGIALVAPSSGAPTDTSNLEPAPEPVAAAPTPAPAPAPAPTSTSTQAQPASVSPSGAVDTLTVAVDSAMIPIKASGASLERVKPSSLTINAANIGAFRVTCDYSHMAYDDPIVYPNQPGRSHLHTFFGNTGTNAYTTAHSLATTGNSTCAGGTVNRSAYWVPSMIDTRTGTPIKPSGSMIYYKTGYNGIKPEQVQPFPAGLRMIAGNAKNTTIKGPFRFVCIGKQSEHLWGPAIQNCPAGAEMWQVIFFPQCWDGVNLDSPDHKSHMSYTVKRACPATHPVPLAEITFNIRYKVTETNAPLYWRLTSDTYDRSLPAGYSSHGDWFNGWKDEFMNTFVKKCNQDSRDCHANLLGDGRTMY